MTSDLGRALAGERTTDRQALRVGTVSAYTAGSKTATIDLDSQLVTLPVVLGSYGVGDTVLVARSGNGAGFVIGRIGTAPAPAPVPVPKPAPVVPPAPTSRPRDRLLLPVEVASYRSTFGWRGPDAYQGDYGGYGVNTGCAFYGDQLAALGADLAKPATIRLTYRRLRGGVYAAQSPTVWTLSQRRRPAGAPTRTGAGVAGTAVPVDGTATFELPAAYTAALLDGTAGGLAIYVPGSTPYMRLAGPASAASSFALAVNYYA